MVNSSGPTVSHNRNFQQDNGETPDGCSHETTNTGKKKRIRPRHRSRKSSKKDDLTLAMNNCRIDDRQDRFQFKFETINNCGIVFRLRNTKCNYINLESFIYNKIPIVFRTVRDKTVKRKRFRQRGKRNRNDKQSIDKITEFADYWPWERIEIGLNNGDLIKGILRINPKNFKEAYVGNEDTAQSDYIITTVVDRNRALEGDEVVLKPKTNVDDPHNTKKAMEVVYILKRNHPRICVGFLKPLHKRRQKKKEFIEFSPRDKRIPRLRIPKLFYPKDYDQNPQLYENCLFSAQITEWTNTNYAIGVVLENLGESGRLHVESLAILKEFCLNPAPIPAEFDCDINDIDPVVDFKDREDLRRLCIFTIDPDTAKDLDDAVSCYRLDNGNYEIGVHISDVTHFLNESTQLDRIVQKKATTIYMVEKAYHMLPLKLCLNCSLLPNVDKLTMSVFWEMTPNGEIVKKRLTKSIINSCVQLSYNHAQLMIENHLNDLNINDFPEISNNFTLNDLYDSVNNLDVIAKKLREKRFKNGSLRLDQIKINFKLDQISGEPIDFVVYENKDAHRLIEEFMLLANITVAETILEHYPDFAFLRLHEPPKQSMLVELQRTLETLGIFIDISTSGSINSSLNKYIGDDCLSKARMIVLQHLFAKPMTRARYFCYGVLCNANDDDDNDFDFSHYALSIPIYTHFTSPIRRYADIMVHRLLKSCLGYCDKPNWTPDYVHDVAEHCNRLKYQAKKAGEASCDLYLAHFIHNHQPFIQKAVVIDCKEKAVDVIVLNTGSVVRLYVDKFGEGVKCRAEQLPISESSNTNCKKMWRIIVEFLATDTLPACLIVLEIFSVITVSLERKLKTNKLEGKLLRP